MPHTGRNLLLAIEEIGDRFQIGRVTDHDTTLGDCLDRAERTMRLIAGA
jgi:hypothetical protein